MRTMRIQPMLSSFIRGVDHRQDKRRRAMLKPWYSRRCTVQDSEKSRNHDLECMRLASDCMQLMGNVRNPALQRHFLRMADVWTAQACWHATQARTAAAIDLGCLPGRAQGHLARHRRGNR